MGNNVRKYGNPPYGVVLVHGGPGAPGEMKPVAEELSKSYGILEPLQTKDTVDGQVEELREVITKKGDTPVVLVGWSWGAWLSFITTSRYPSLFKKLILVSSGPFLKEYARKIMSTRLSRLSEKDELKVEKLLKLFSQTETTLGDKLFEEFGELISKADSYNPLLTMKSDIKTQPEIYKRVWKEAEELRRSGRLLEYGNNISCPVVVVHGNYDPHPFKGVKEPLSKVFDNCKFILLKNCGHQPWYEKEAMDKFYEILRREINREI